MKTLKMFVRNFKKNKITGILGIISLAIGVAIILLIGTWCLNEVNFDNFHKNPESIYRVCRKAFINNESIIVGSVFGPLGKTILNDCPEITDMVRVYELNETLVTVGEKKDLEKNIYVVDTSFFNFFNFGLKTGSMADFINKPNSILIDENMANKYFPGKNPIGESLSFNGQREIVGILYSSSGKSHLKFQALIPINSMPNIDNMRWGNNDNYMTYVRIKDNVSIHDLETKITGIAQEHFSMYKEVSINHFLQPLNKIHFSSNFRFDRVIKTNPKIVSTFGLISIIILLLASVNFINLFISTSFKRAKEIGIKKTNGARRTLLMRSFFVETCIYAIIATTIGVIIAFFVLPVFNQFIDYNLTLNFKDPQLYFFIFGLILTITILAGSFPAFQLSRLNTLATLKEQFKGKKTSPLQKSLIIFQFTVSIALLVSIMLIRGQLRFMENADLGFNKKQVIYLEMNQEMAKDYKRICQELQKHPQVKSANIKNCTPIDWNSGMAIADAKRSDISFIAEINKVTPGYFEMMEMPIVNGDAFSETEQGHYCILNEKAVKTLSFDDQPIDQHIILDGETLTVKGIVKDAFTKSLHQEVDPQVYLNITQAFSGYVLMVKPSGDNLKSVIDLLEKEWRQFKQDRPFEYHFLDKDYEQLYKAETNAKIILGWAVLISLLITAAGLWGMATHATNRRVKEIGVRKVNGARLPEILAILNIDFIKWVIIGFIIASPISWFLMSKWLENFVLKISLHWGYFIFAGLIALVITLASVSWQSWRVANRNPVEALRYE